MTEATRLAVEAHLFEEALVAVHAFMAGLHRDPADWPQVPTVRQFATRLAWMWLLEDLRAPGESLERAGRRAAEVLGLDYDTVSRGVRLDQARAGLRMAA